MVILCIDQGQEDTVLEHQHSVDHGEDGWDHQPGAQQPRMPGFRQGWQNGQGPEDLPQEPHDDHLESVAERSRRG